MNAKRGAEVWLDRSSLVLRGVKESLPVEPSGMAGTERSKLVAELIPKKILGIRESCFQRPALDKDLG